MNARNIDFTGMAYLVGIAFVLYGVYRIAKAGPAVAGQVGTAVTTALNALNPANPNNIVAAPVNSVIQAATGQPDVTLGTKLWEWLHPSTVALEKQLTASVDAEDADLGRAMLDRMSATAQWGNTFTAADQEDRDLGAALTAAGASVPMQLSPNFTYQTRAGLNF
jgi:hypothetical protein